MQASLARATPSQPKKSVHQNGFFRARHYLGATSRNRNNVQERHADEKGARTPHGRVLRALSQPAWLLATVYSAQRSQMLLAQAPTPGPRRCWCQRACPSPAAGTMSSVPALQPQEYRPAMGLPSASVTFEAAGNSEAALALVAHGDVEQIGRTGALERLQEQGTAEVGVLAVLADGCCSCQRQPAGCPGPLPWPRASSSMELAVLTLSPACLMTSWSTPVLGRCCPQMLHHSCQPFVQAAGLAARRGRRSRSRSRLPLGRMAKNGDSACPSM